MVTEFPGPKNKEYIASMGSMACNLTQHFPVNLQESKGNYVTDIDGNTMLDVFNSIGVYALGYNHPALLEASKSDLMASVVANRTALGICPP